MSFELYILCNSTRFGLPKDFFLYWYSLKQCVDVPSVKQNRDIDVDIGVYFNVNLRVAF